MEKKQGILKETPEYEAKLSVQELRELGIIKCGGCKSSGKCATCNCSIGCCKKSTKLEIKK